MLNGRQSGVILSIFLIVLSTTIISAPNVYAYYLTVQPYGGSNDQQRTGVDIYVLNKETKVDDLKQFYGLPPESVVFYFPDYQFPVDSSFSVCAVQHSTDLLYKLRKLYCRSEF